MKPLRTAANDEGKDWDTFWALHIQQLPDHPIRAANDNDADPTSTGLSGFVMCGLVVLIVLAGALAGRV